MNKFILTRDSLMYLENHFADALDCMHGDTFDNLDKAMNNINVIADDFKLSRGDVDVNIPDPSDEGELLEKDK